MLILAATLKFNVSRKDRKLLLIATQLMVKTKKKQRTKSRQVDVFFVYGFFSLENYAYEQPKLGCNKLSVVCTIDFGVPFDLNTLNFYLLFLSKHYKNMRQKHQNCTQKKLLPTNRKLTLFQRNCQFASLNDSVQPQKNEVANRQQTKKRK